MTVLQKFVFITGASLLLGGCSLDINGMINGTLKDGSASPTPSPVVETQTQATPNPSAGKMGSGSYSMQGTTTISNGDDDTSLEKDLNEVNVNSNLEMMAQ